MKSPSSLRVSFTIDNRHLSVCEALEWQRDATERDDLHERSERKTTSTGSSRVFTVRPGCRSPLSSIWSLFLAVLNLNGKEERGTLKIPASHGGAVAATHRGIYNRALFILYWAAYVHTSRNSRRTRGVRLLRSWILSIVTSSEFPRQEARKRRRRADYLSQRIAEFLDKPFEEYTRLRQRNPIYFNINWLFNFLHKVQIPRIDIFFISHLDRVSQENPLSIPFEEMQYSCVLSRGIDPRIREASSRGHAVYLSNTCARNNECSRLANTRHYSTLCTPTGKRVGERLDIARRLPRVTLHPRERRALSLSFSREDRRRGVDELLTSFSDLRAVIPRATKHQHRGIIHERRVIYNRGRWFTEFEEYLDVKTTGRGYGSRYRGRRGASDRILIEGDPRNYFTFDERECRRSYYGFPTRLRYIIVSAVYVYAIAYKTVK